jgi:hypothetical protein
MNEHDNEQCVRDDGVVKGGTAERVSSSKRTLLKAGWVAPLIAVISLPASGMVHSSCDPRRPGC